MTDYLDFFSHDEAEKLLSAIREAEKRTSGEIRVHIEDYCNHLVIDRAVQIFEKLGMTNTKERNGVLFYLSVKDRDFAVLGDKGIHEKVGEQYWLDLSRELEKEFRQNLFVEGLVAAIGKATVALERFFPIAKEDKNELSDDLSIGQI